MCHGCMVYTERAETAAVFTRHQPCNNQTALYVHKFGGYSKRDIKSNSHSFRIARDKSAVSLVESGE